MSQEQQEFNGDSFSLHEDSPEFGQNNLQGPSHDDIIAELKKKLKATTASLREQQDEHKNQLLHLETVSMMTKYQLVFIKMESSLIKVAHIVKNKESTHIAQAFHRILLHNKTTHELRKYKTQLIYHNVKDNTERMSRALANLYKGSLSRGFKAIYFTAETWKNERLLKNEKEKYAKTFSEALANKDKEIASYIKKIEELNGQVAASRSKETDFASKLKHKEKQLAALELEKVDILKSKKSMSGDSTSISIKVLEERLRDLSSENDDLKDKLCSAESNVGTFIREMSELLDSHELSLNIGSDENASFHNPQDLEEEFGSSTKGKDKGIQNRNKENQSKSMAQRNGYPSRKADSLNVYS